MPCGPAADELARICENRQRDEEFLNPSIGTFLNDETGRAMKLLFFNQPRSADVVFRVEGDVTSVRLRSHRTRDASQREK